MTLLMVLHHPFSYLILNFSKNMFLFFFCLFLFLSDNSEVSKV
jgi:hypothetical protein